jgi:hypothetical protein
MRWAGHVALWGTGAQKFQLGNPVRNRPFGESRCRWEDNVKVSLKEVGWEWSRISCSEYRHMVGFCEHVYEPSGSIKCGPFLD